MTVPARGTVGPSDNPAAAERLVQLDDDEVGERDSDDEHPVRGGERLEAQDVRE